MANRAKAPPKPDKADCVEPRVALLRLNEERDDAAIRTLYRWWWHELERRQIDPNPKLGWVALKRILKLSHFKKGSFSAWRLTGRAVPTHYKPDLVKIANYISDTVGREAEGKPTAKTMVGDAFITGWYGAVDGGLHILDSVLQNVPGYYVIYRVSGFNPLRITRGAMLIWKYKIGDDWALRTVEINRFIPPLGEDGADGFAQAKKEPFEEVYFGVALRKKGWLLIESFLGNEGDPSSYRFALQHDDVPAKYQCLLGHYFAFPSPPYASPTIRSAVLQRIAPEPAALRDQAAALARLQDTIIRVGMPELDLVPPQKIDVTVRELLANPSFKHCLVELPPTKD